MSSDHPAIVFDTPHGQFVAELYPDRAPVTAANFLRYVDESYYRNGHFYRIVHYSNDHGRPKINVIQGGLNYAVKPFEPIAHETTQFSGLKNERGVLSMARYNVGTASSEFSISVTDNLGLDYGETRNPDREGFAAFGRVIEGIEIIDRLHKLAGFASSSDPYTDGQILKSPIPFSATRQTRP